MGGAPANPNLLPGRETRAPASRHGAEPPPTLRPSPRRQGGGRRRVEDRAVLAGIVFVATAGCAWRQLPQCFTASWQTVHRRFTEWSKAGDLRP
ncbi:MAG TPA: transposase, partial [Mycobacteriales bacterium]